MKKKQDPVFYNKDGTLTKYAFACGYVQQEHFDISGHLAKKDIYQEHTTYHFRLFIDDKKIFWKSYDLEDYDKVQTIFKTLSKTLSKDDFQVEPE